MAFNLPNPRDAKPSAMSKASSESTHQLSRSSTLTRQSDSSFMDEKEAHVKWAEVKESNSKAKTSKLSRIVQAIKNIEPPEPVLPEGRRANMPAWAR